MKLHNNVISEMRRDRVIASVVTVAIGLLLLLVLRLLKLTYNPELRQRHDSENTAELLLEDEWVARGDILEVSVQQTPGTSSPSPQGGGVDVTDRGEKADASPKIVTSTNPQEVKVAERAELEKSGPTEAELAERELERQREETARRIASSVKFGSGNASSNQANASGSGSKGNGDGAPGVSNGVGGHSLKGRTATLSKPRGNAAGKIVVAVKVDRQGRVVEARYHSGSGAVATSIEARRSCEQAALSSRFSVDENAQEIVSGTITFNFK